MLSTEFELLPIPRLFEVDHTRPGRRVVVLID